MVLLEKIGLPATLPTPLVTLALPLARVLLKENTIVWLPLVSRHSTPVGPLTGKSILKIPAPPCDLLDTAVTNWSGLHVSGAGA